jgi:hypothetical protein
MSGYTIHDIITKEFVTEKAEGSSNDRKDGRV